MRLGLFARLRLFWRPVLEDCRGDACRRLLVLDEAKARLEDEIRDAMARAESARRSLSLGELERKAFRGASDSGEQELDSRLLLPSDEEGRARTKRRKS